jgi:hypothetical protein
MTQTVVVVASARSMWASGSLRSRARGGKGASRACASERRDPRGAPWRSWRRSGASACPRSRRTGRRARAARRSRSSRASRQVDARFERSVRGVRGRRGARAGSREGDCGVNAARARRRCVHVPRVVTGEGATRAERRRYFSHLRVLRGFERPVFFDEPQLTSGSQAREKRFTSRFRREKRDEDEDRLESALQAKRGDF